MVPVYYLPTNKYWFFVVGGGGGGGMGGGGGGGQREKYRKIALLSLYLLYFSHV